MSLPITILTGFLGAGKTTLLNTALREPSFARALVVVNELGQVPLDHLLVREVREDVLLLDSGCVCCSIRGDLVETLCAEAAKRSHARFDRVFVETTGLADPTPIVATLLRHPRLAEQYHLDAIVTAVDAQHATATLLRFEEARRQVALADDLILTKTDAVSADVADGAHQAAQALNPTARFFEAKNGHVDWAQLLTWTPSTVASRLGGVTLDAPHRSGDVQAFSVRSSEPTDYRAFALWLSMMVQLYGETLLRVKGLLRVEGEPGPLVIQAVQHVVHPVYAMPNWPDADRDSRLTFITQGLSVSLFHSLHESVCQLLGASKFAAVAPAGSLGFEVQP